MTLCGDMNCSQCCHDREVILTHKDVEKLLTMGHYEQVFARPSRWGHNLKEIIFMDGQCVFLKSGACSVYHNRPTACRIFPLTLGEGRPEMDPSCPHRDIFKEDPIFVEQANSGLKRIIEDVERTISSSKKRTLD